MMDQKLKAEWIAALRSGEYKQVQSVLEDNTSEHQGFCCLGVLCKITGHETLTDVMPSYRWVKQQIVGHYDKLIAMNDDQSKSFSQIADYIEANL